MQPALYEAFGLTVIEAMVGAATRACPCSAVSPHLTPLRAQTCGLPVFVTNKGGPAEIVVDQVSGFHIDPFEVLTAAAITAVLWLPAAAEAGRRGRGAAGLVPSMWGVQGEAAAGTMAAFLENVVKDEKAWLQVSSAALERIRTTCAPRHPAAPATPPPAACHHRVLHTQAPWLGSQADLHAPWPC